MKYPISDKMKDLIEETFTFHPVQPGQAERYEAIRAKAKEMATLIAELSPASAEQTLSFRHLQEAVMFANASIAIHEA